MCAMDTTLQSEHEQAMVRAFVVRGRQERFSLFLSSPKNREKLTKELAHFRWFDGKFATAVPWKVDPRLKLWDTHLQGIQNVLRLLRSKGAAQTCSVISEDFQMHPHEFQLQPSLQNVIAPGTQTL